MMSNLFRLEELCHESIVVGARSRVGRARDEFNVGAQRGVEKLCDLCVVIVVVSYPVEAMDEVPDGSTKRRRINVRVCSTSV